MKKFIIGLGAAYCFYAMVLVVSIIAALMYDYINGGNEAFHWVYKMQTGNWS